MIKSLDKILMILVILTGLHPAFGQVGGRQSYAFLDIPAFARLSSLGGINVSDRGRDVSFGWENPALLDSAVLGVGAVSYLDYLADINATQVAYATSNRKTGGYWHAGIKYFGLGEIEATDEIGNVLGTYNNREYAIGIGHSRQAGNFAFGVNAKFIGSHIVNFTSSAMLFDLGGAFVHPTEDLTVGLTIRNLGFVLSRYTEQGEMKLPLDVQTGVSFKPRYMPARLSLTLHSLTNGDISYYNENDRLADEPPGTFDKIMLHTVLAAELVLHRNFSAMLGYNHQRRKELRLPSTSGGSGFSFGFQARVSYFMLAYSRALYHVAGGSNTFTLAADFNRIFK